MALAYPLIAWGTADDISGAGWSSIGTPIVTGGQADPFGGASAYLLNDDDAVVGEARNKAFVPLASAVQIPIFVRQGTATIAGWLVYDVTSAGANRGYINLTGWGTGTPTVVSGGTLGTVSVSVSPVISVGGGWYMAIASVTGLVVGNSYLFYCYPANNNGSAGASMGSTYFYVRNSVLFDVPQNPIAWRTPRAGTEKVRGLDGGFDTWLTGKDSKFRGEFAWIPSAPRSSPAIVSGWEGLNESTGINCGVQAMLEAGWNAQSLTFVPDRSDCTTSIASELVKPFDQDEPTMKPNGDRSLILELGSSGTVPYPMPI